MYEYAFFSFHGFRQYRLQIFSTYRRSAQVRSDKQTKHANSGLKNWFKHWIMKMLYSLWANMLRENILFEHLRVLHFVKEPKFCKLSSRNITSLPPPMRWRAVLKREMRGGWRRLTRTLCLNKVKNKFQKLFQCCGLDICLHERFDTVKKPTRSQNCTKC